jgi:GNAT superfamily N-acetyltransferase
VPLDGRIRNVLYESGLPLHERYVFYGSTEEQARALTIVQRALAGDQLTDDALRSLAVDERTMKALDALLDLRSEEGFDDIMRGYLEGTVVSLERELVRRNPLERPDDIAERVRAEIEAWPLFEKGDVLEIEGTDILWVNCVLLRFSPRWDGRPGAWDRDTQMMFQMVFGSGLFVWLSMNVASEFHGRRIGSSFIERMEKFARAIGFRRFIVPGPNRKFWCGRFAYGMHPAHEAVGGGGYGSFLHEVYKEV